MGYWCVLLFDSQPRAVVNLTPHVVKFGRDIFISRFPRIVSKIMFLFFIDKSLCEATRTTF